MYMDFSDLTTTHDERPTYLEALRVNFPYIYAVDWEEERAILQAMKEAHPEAWKHIRYHIPNESQLGGFIWMLHYSTNNEQTCLLMRSYLWIKDNYIDESVLCDTKFAKAVHAFLTYKMTVKGLNKALRNAFDPKRQPVNAKEMKRRREREGERFE